MEGAKYLFNKWKNRWLTTERNYNPLPEQNDKDSQKLHLVTNQRGIDYRVTVHKMV
jgi:hypothetical protein